MADEKVTLASISFNQQPGATVAVDSSGKGRNAQIVNGHFIEGRSHNAAYFPDSGYAEIEEAFVPLDGEYTFAFWIKAELTEHGPEFSWVLVKFPGGDDRYLYLDLYSPLTDWNYVAIAQNQDSIAAYVNSTQVSVERFPYGWGKPTGWVIVNDNGYSDAGYATIEDLHVYEGDDGGIVIPPTEMARSEYYVNGVNFRDYNVKVKNATGIIDNLTMKPPMVIEWDDYHGEVIDLTAPRYLPRDITVSCFITGIGKNEFISKVQAFINAFQKPGTQRFHAKYSNETQIPYEVYILESINLEKKFNDAEMVGTFELKLREPQPVKRVLKATGGTVNITLTSNQMVDIYWGDGTNTKNVYGANQTRSHAYSGSGEFYIIIAGVIEDITGFSTNAQIVWPILK